MTTTKQVQQIHLLVFGSTISNDLSVTISPKGDTVSDAKVFACTV
jgi:hypothetical protein